MLPDPRHHKEMPTGLAPVPPPQRSHPECQVLHLPACLVCSPALCLPLHKSRDWGKERKMQKGDKVKHKSLRNSLIVLPSLLSPGSICFWAGSCRNTWGFSEMSHMEIYMSHEHTEALGERKFGFWRVLPVHVCLRSLVPMGRHKKMDASK